MTSNHLLSALSIATPFNLRLQSYPHMGHHQAPSHLLLLVMICNENYINGYTVIVFLLIINGIIADGIS